MRNASVVAGVCALLSALAIGAASLGDPVQWPISAGGNGHWYEFVDHGSTISWREAAIEAGRREYPPGSGNYGYLATLTSAVENDFVVTLIDDPAWAWLGGYEEPEHDWRWIEHDGIVEPWEWTNWVPGEPSGDGDYLDMMCYEWTGMWNDEGNPVHRYLVEYAGPLPGCSYCFEGDLDGDCDVDLADLAILLANYGKTNPTDGLIAYYPLDGDAFDYSGKDNHATIHGGPNFVDDIPDALCNGQSLCFDGEEDFLMLTRPFNPLGSDYTVAFWMKTLDDQNYIVHSWGPGGPPEYEAFIISLSYVPTRLLVYQSGSAVWIDGTAVIDDEWHHVAITRSIGGSANGTVTIYVDGENRGSGDEPQPESPATETTIGAANPQSDNFAGYQGCLDDLRFYDRVLTETEIRTLAGR